MLPATRTLVWEGLDVWRAEIARVELADDGLRATRSGAETQAITNSGGVVLYPGLARRVGAPAAPAVQV